MKRAAASGVRQYVILGAGLDSFAHRRHDLLDRGRTDIDIAGAQRLAAATVMSAATP